MSKDQGGTNSTALCFFCEGDAEHTTIACINIFNCFALKILGQVEWTLVSLLHTINEQLFGCIFGVNLWLINIVVAYLRNSFGLCSACLPVKNNIAFLNPSVKSSLSAKLVGDASVNNLKLGHIIELIIGNSVCHLNGEGKALPCCFFLKLIGLHIRVLL